MFFEETSPKLSLPFEGDEIDFGERIHSKEILPHGREGNQPFSGNKCGHVPSSPREYLRPPQHKRRPLVLVNGIKYIRDRFYYNPLKYLKELFNGSQMRSERREAIVCVVQVLFHYLSLETLTVGYFIPNGSFINLNLWKIAKIAGMPIMRTKRALWDLIEAGYIKVTPQHENPSIREVSISLFRDLGIDLQQLNFHREWKRKQSEKNVSKVFSSILKKAKSYIPNKNTYTQEQTRLASKIANETGRSHIQVLKEILNTS